MERRVWPVELPTNCEFTELEKEVYLKIKRTKANCWFLVDIDPIGMCNEKISMGLIIYPEKGIISFSIHDGISSETMAPTAEMYINLVEDKIYNLLMERIMLQV